VLHELSTTPCRRMGEWMYRSPFFLTSALVGGEWSDSRSCRFTPREAPGTDWIGSWVDPRAGLEHMEKWKFLTLPGLEPRPLSRPARSQSLYRLRYPGSPVHLYFPNFLPLLTDWEQFLLLGRCSCQKLSIWTWLKHITSLWVNVKVMLRPTLSRPFYLGVMHPPGA
jgi:hypothetical protein